MDKDSELVARQFQLQVIIGCYEGFEAKLGKLIGEVVSEKTQLQTLLIETNVELEKAKGVKEKELEK